MGWNLLKYILWERFHWTIGSQVWATQFMRLLGKKLYVHNTAFAESENSRLSSNFFGKNGFSFFQLSEAVAVQLPTANNARDVVVNDLREILVEKIYEFGDARIRPNDIVIDCGANIGLFSLLALSRMEAGGQLIAIEPVPSIRELLETNLSRVISPGKYHVCERPVYCDTRSMTLSLDEDVFTMHRLDMDRSAGKSAKIQVRTATIDDLVNDFRLPRVDFIKMDIEGAEIAALRGAAMTLKRWKPRLAISAYHQIDDFYEIPRLIYSLNPDYHTYVTRSLSPLCYAW